MGVATETYAEMEAELMAACDRHGRGGPPPGGWTLTSELYRQLDYGGDHFATCGRAIFHGETPKPLYQLPVSLTPGAHHAWSLHLAEPA